MNFTSIFSIKTVEITCNSSNNCATSWLPIACGEGSHTLMCSHFDAWVAHENLRAPVDQTLMDKILHGGSINGSFGRQHIAFFLSNRCRNEWRVNCSAVWDASLLPFPPQPFPKIIDLIERALVKPCYHDQLMTSTICVTEVKHHILSLTYNI